MRNAPNCEDFVATKENLWEVLTFLPGEVSTTGWDFDWDDDELLASSPDLLGRLNQALRDYPGFANEHVVRAGANASTRDA